MVNRERLEKARAWMALKPESDLERVDNVRAAVWQLIEALTPYQDPPWPGPETRS